MSVVESHNHHNPRFRSETQCWEKGCAVQNAKSSWHTPVLNPPWWLYIELTQKILLWFTSFWKYVMGPEVARIGFSLISMSIYGHLKDSQTAGMSLFRNWLSHIVHVYMCMYAHTHTQIVYVYIYIYICIYIYMYVYIYIYMYVYIYINI